MKFFTGYRKFTTIDVIVGLFDGQIYLLTNPLFSDKYSNLIEQLEQIKSNHIDLALIDEIVKLYKETGANITTINRKSNKYQIGFGENKWRIMKFHINTMLKITTKPNYNLTERFSLFDWLNKTFKFRLK